MSTPPTDPGRVLMWLLVIILFIVVLALILSVFDVHIDSAPRGVKKPPARTSRRIPPAARSCPIFVHTPSSGQVSP